MTEKRRIVVKNGEFLATEWLQENRFTDSAQRFLEHAYQRAGDRGIDGCLPAVLVLWSMLRWERKVGTVVLEKCGVDLRVLEADVDAELNALPSQNPWIVGLDFGQLGRLAIRAIQEARALGHPYVGSEHLILALFAAEDDVSQKLFAKHGITADRYREVLGPLLRGDN